MNLAVAESRWGTADRCARVCDLPVRCRADRSGFEP